MRIASRVAAPVVSVRMASRGPHQTGARRRVLPRTGPKYGLEAHPPVRMVLMTTSRGRSHSSRGTNCAALISIVVSKGKSTDGLDGIERAGQDAHRRRSRGDASSPRQYG